MNENQFLESIDFNSSQEKNCRDPWDCLRGTFWAFSGTIKYWNKLLTKLVEKNDWTVKKEQPSSY